VYTHLAWERPRGAGELYGVGSVAGPQHLVPEINTGPSFGHTTVGSAPISELRAMNHAGHGTAMVETSERRGAKERENVLYLQSGLEAC